MGVLWARVALAECLMQTGWSPDRKTEAALLLDLELLDEPHGSFERTPALHTQVQ